mmetsp:Transcript_28303/g.44144  ORF Transcript_28303/g.44144 Transcript_28303/m.44144 type:complete len:594 (-) Transcript_28303:449-2230(-)
MEQSPQTPTPSHEWGSEVEALALPANECEPDTLVSLLLCDHDDKNEGYEFGEQLQGFLHPYQEDFDPFGATAPVPVVKKGGMARLRAKVMAMRAFQGLVKTIKKKDVNSGTMPPPGAPCNAVGKADDKHKGLRRPSVGDDTIAQLRAASRTLNSAVVTKESVALMSEAVGNDIDEFLKKRDDAGDAVLDMLPELETPWNLPDLAVIFRPPPDLMEAMAVGISPGKWIQIAPGQEQKPTHEVNQGKNKWNLLKSAVNTGIAFKLIAKDRSNNSEEQNMERRQKVQCEVDQFKSWILNITSSWEEMMMSQVEEDASPDLSRASSLTQPMVRGQFLVKAIATGLCHLFPSVDSEKEAIVDVVIVAQHCPKNWPENSECQITECSVPGANKDGKDGKATRRNKQINEHCTIKLKMPKSEGVTLKIWSNGRTQTTGCKDREMLVKANQTVSEAIRHIHKMHVASPDAISPVFREGKEEHGDSQGQVKVLSAPLLGSWDLNLKRQGAKLHLAHLCEFLSQESTADRVMKATHVPAVGNSARFNNLSLYIKREALKSWPQESHTDQASVYVNVYEGGKCSVLAVPNYEVAEELADVVSDM